MPKLAVLAGELSKIGDLSQQSKAGELAKAG